MIKESNTRQEAESTYRWISAIYLFMAVTAWIVSSTFIVSWMTDGSLDYSGWNSEMWLYCITGLMITAAVTLGQYVHYQSGESEGYQSALVSLLVVLMFVSFSAGSEMGNVLQRHDSSQQVKSVNSETFKASKENYREVLEVATASTISPQMQTALDKKAKADFEIGNCQRHASAGQARIKKCLIHERANYSAASNSIRELERLEARSAENNKGVLDTAKDHMKEFANNDDHASAIVKVLMNIGLSSLQAALLIAIFIVLAFEVAYHLVGKLKSQAKMHLNGFTDYYPVRTPEFKSVKVEPEEAQKEPAKKSKIGFIPAFGVGIGSDGLSAGIGGAIVPKAVLGNPVSKPIQQLGSTEIQADTSPVSIPEKHMDSIGFTAKTRTDSRPSSVPIQEKTDTEFNIESLYQDFITACKSEEFKTSKSDFNARACKEWLCDTAKNHKHKISLGKAQKVVAKWLDKAGNSGEFGRNPKWTKEGKSCKWVLK